VKNVVITGNCHRRKNFPIHVLGVKAKKFTSQLVTEDFQGKPDQKSGGRFQAVCEGKKVLG